MIGVWQQWQRRTAVTPLHDTRHGTPPKVEGDSLSAILSGRRGIVMYDRATDTLHVSVAEPGARSYPDNDAPGMSRERRKELDDRYGDEPRVKYVSSEFKDGFGLRLDGGHIEPYNGGMGGAPTRATMFNPLGVEALARLLDAEPAFGRWMTHEQQSFYGDRGPSYTARDWVARYSDMRTTFASRRTAGRWEYLDQRWVETKDGRRISLSHVELPRWGTPLRAILAEDSPRGREIGFLSYEFVGDLPPRVDHVEVQPPYQRQGIATAMWRYAEEVAPGIQHSHLQLPDGRAWIESLGSRTANSWSHLTLFHGTCDYWAQRILREGLRPRTDTGVRGGWSNEALSHDGRVYLAVRGSNILSSAMREAVESAAYDAYRDRIAELSPGWEYDGHNLMRLASTLGRWGGGDFRYGDPQHIRDEEGMAKAQDLSARLYAALRGEGGFAPVLLEVKVPREHWGQFEADEDTYAYSVPGAGETGMPEWLLSLGADAVVAYRGTIPASWITVAQKGWR